ncbi:MAG: T9SS type A sorting domain-containing protein [Bacteroidia bacterium]
MKKVTLVISGLLCLQSVFAQQAAKSPFVRQITNPNTHEMKYPNGVYFSEAKSFGETRPFRELAAEQEAMKQVDVFDRKEADRKRSITAIGNPAASTEDGALQSRHASRILTAPGLNFTAQNGGGGASPLDPNGSCGLTAYVQVVNSTYQAWNKTTGAALMSSLNLTNIWGNGFCDAVVLYDKYADRWFIGMLSSVSTDCLCAVSKTNDPTGAYYTWTFSYASTESSGIDYPKWSIWQDGYYLGMNLPTQEISVFNRTQMIAGNPSAGTIVKTSPNLPNAGFFCPMPADADGSLPPAGTPCYIFAFEDDNWGSPAVKDQIHILKMTTNWTTPSSTTLVEDTPEGSPLAVTTFNSYWSNYGTEVAQKGSSQGLDAIQGIFMFRAQFRVWTGYNSVVLCNSVNTGSGQSAMRWYELRQNQSTKAWTVYQQGTYSPDAENRWMGSIAMDGNGNIAMGFCVSGTGEYPSIRYVGRYPSDPLGTFGFAEQTAKAGLGSQSGGNRWGDYANTAIDPSDDLTFWHTSMYGGSGGAEETQVFNFKITPSVATGVEENKTGDLAFQAYLDNSSNMLVKAINLTSNDEVQVDLFDIEGKSITGKKIVPVANTIETNFSTTGLAKGTYLVRIGNLNFQRVIKVAVN